MKRILITEDDKTYSDALTFCLEDEHYEILCVPDGIRGYLRANLWHPDLILMDVNLGASTGFEVAKEILDTDIPIIFMTADNCPQHIEQAKKFNSIALFHKPFNVKQLLETIKETLAGHKLPEFLVA